MEIALNYGITSTTLSQVPIYGNNTICRADGIRIQGDLRFLKGLEKTKHSEICQL